VAESVNFALEEWLPYCRLAVENYRFMRKATFPYEMFVLKAATNPDNADVARMCVFSWFFYFLFFLFFYFFFFAVAA
jgi:hypothetical protein